MGNASNEENVSSGVEMQLLIELSDLCQCAWNFGSHEQKAIMCCTGSQTFSTNSTWKMVEKTTKIDQVEINQV